MRIGAYHKLPRSLVLLGLCLGVFAKAPAYAMGEAGAQFLKIPMGAKACAMGEAFVALADDPSAIYWNPAGLALLNSLQVMGMHALWLEDMSYQYIAASYSNRAGSFGLSVVYSSSGDISGYDENLSPTGSYTAYDFASTAAFSRRFAERLCLGVGIKLIQQKIEAESASGFALDFGALYQDAFFEGFRIGFAAQNLGPGIKFIEKSDPLPLALRTGVSYARGPFTFTGDIHKPRFNDLRIHAGVEFTLLKVLSIRAGYLTRPHQENGATAGVGVFWRNLRVDYAFVPYDEVNNTHRFGVMLAF